jgi:2'-5' RNA ligase
MRYFASIVIPEQASARLRALQEESRAFCTGSFPRSFHLTLAFYGERDRGEIESLRESLSSLDFNPFEVSFNGLGCFPNRLRPRVLWAGVESSGLFDLQSRIALATNYEEKRFHAHATLCRIRDCKSRELFDWIQKNNGEFARFRVDAFTLMKSELTPSGAVHSIIKKYAASAP